MAKNDFLKGFEEVMGTHFTWHDFIIGLLMVAAGLLVLQVGELVHDFISSFHWI